MFDRERRGYIMAIQVGSTKDSFPNNLASHSFAGKDSCADRRTLT